MMCSLLASAIFTFASSYYLHICICLHIHAHIKISSFLCSSDSSFFFHQNYHSNNFILCQNTLLRHSLMTTEHFIYRYIIIYIYQILFLHVDVVFKFLILQTATCIYHQDEWKGFSFNPYQKFLEVKLLTGGSIHC